MKLFTALAALTLIAAPAVDAMDYVKCEAMQSAIERTAREAVIGSKRVYSEWLEADYLARCGVANPSSLSELQCANAGDNEPGIKIAAVYKAQQINRLNKIKADYQAAGCY